MKKRSLLIVVALLCMASLMAAMAFTSATVTNATSFKVSNTDSALLALEAGNHNAAFYSKNNKAVSNSLVIDFAKGNSNTVRYGVQQDSIYEWDDLFKLTNNSENNIKVSINTSNPTPEANVQSIVNLKTESDGEDEWVSVAGRNSQHRKTLTFELAPGEDIYIDAQIDSDDNDGRENKDLGFDLVVKAERVDKVQVSE